MIRSSIAMMTNCKVYIRFGLIPKDDRSTIKSHGEVIGKEIGVSVWECEIKKDKYHMVFPKNPTEHTADDFDYMMNLYTENDDIFLVTGTEVGKGSDGEPLLRNIKVIRQLKRSEIGNDRYYQKNPQNTIPIAQEITDG